MSVDPATSPAIRGALAAIEEEEKVRVLFAVETRTMPPTPFAELVAAPWISDEERAWVAELLVRKASLTEADRVELPEARRAALSAEVERLAALGPALGVRRPRDSGIEERLDSILLRWAGPPARRDAERLPSTAAAGSPRGGRR